MHTKRSFIFPLFVIAVGCSTAFAQDSSSADTSASLSQTLPSTYKKTAAFKVPASVTERTTPLTPVAGSGTNGYVQFRVYVLKVHRSDPNVAIIESDAGGRVTGVVPFNYGTELAYKGEAGWSGSNNFGFRASYFYTNQKAQENRTGAATAPFFRSPRPLFVTYTGPASTGTPATFSQNLKLDVVDLEGTYKWHADTWTVLGSAGVRIARVRQVYTAHDTYGANSVEDLTYTQQRTGYGPTAALDFRYKLGGSNFWWKGSGRFAVIFGSIKEAASFVGTGGGNSAAVRSSSPRTWVIEVETGIEWEHKTSGNHVFFIDGNFIVHQWNSAVIATPVSPVGGSSSAILDNPTLPPTAKGNIRFLGGSFSAGFRF